MLSAQPQQDIRVHDPVAIQQGDTYYLFCTGMGIFCFSSKDLKNWKQEESVFAEKPAWTDSVVPNFRNHIWAPDVSYHNGQYYLYYSVSSFGKNTSAIGVATNPTLDPQDKLAMEYGPWVYAIEEVDNTRNYDQIRLQENDRFKTRKDEDVMGGIMVIENKKLTAVPYYLWSNRGIGKMKVWINKKN